MTTYEEALAKAQAMIDAAMAWITGNTLDKANTLLAAAQVQLDLADHLKAIAPEPEETPSEASLGLLLRMLEDGNLEEMMANGLGTAHVTDSHAAAHLMVHLVRGVIHAAPTEQRVTLVIATPEPNETSSPTPPLCNAEGDHGIRCVFWSGHTHHPKHSWES